MCQLQSIERAVKQGQEWGDTSWSDWGRQAALSGNSLMCPKSEGRLKTADLCWAAPLSQQCLFIVCSLICCLFNDAVCSLGYIAWRCRMISEIIDLVRDRGRGLFSRSTVKTQASPDGRCAVLHSNRPTADLLLPQANWCVIKTLLYEPK